MRHCLVWPQALLRIPAKALREEVEECFIITLDSTAEGLAARSSSPAFTGNCDSWLERRVEEELPSGCLFDNVPSRWAEDFHNAGKLLLFVLAGEDRISGKQFSKNAPETPHVDAKAIVTTKNDLWRTVETRLNVRIHFFVCFARTSEIDNSYIGTSRVAKKYVLGLEIAVNDSLRLKEA